MKQRGFALVFIILLVAVLLLYVLEFNFDSRVELQMTQYRVKRLQALEIARSSLGFVKAALANDLDKNMDYLGEEWSQIGYYSRLFGVIFPGAVVNVVIEDESGKLNVNKLLVKKKKEKKLVLDTWLDERLRSMGEILFNEAAFVDAIIDWIDSDNTEYFAEHASQNGGAEDGFYQGLKQPYVTKNRKLDCLDELILLRGIDEERYFGQGGAESPGLRDVTTIYSDGKINVNTASRFVLESLHPLIEESLAEKIVKNRQDNPFTSASVFLNMLREEGIKINKDDKLKTELTIMSSGVFKVEILVNYQGIDCSVEAVIDRNRENEVITSKVKY